MKTVISKLTGKMKFVYLFTAAIIIVSGSLFSGAAYGGDSTETPKAPAEIKLLGILNTDEVLFEVVFDNKTREVFDLTITDQEGYVFYKARFQDRTFSKKFLFNKLENGNANLTFTIKTGNSKQSESFEVNTQLLENASLTKL